MDDLTCTYGEFVTFRVKWLGSNQEDIIHASIGLIGEAVELANFVDTENFVEELGDLEFYYEHACQVIRRIAAFGPQKPVDREELRSIELAPIERLIFWTGELLDIAKKSWVYQKDMQSLNWSDPLGRIQIILSVLANQHGVTRLDVQEKNRAKLIKRYPSGYTDAAAQARADKVT